MYKSVSVIVPVYNTVRDLPRCLDSLINQTYKNIEIIVIDDGSTDGSSDICDHYAECNRNIKVIHQDNKGLVATRKAGVMAAAGELIGFVDSDDYVDEYMYEELTRQMEIHHADVVSSGYTKVHTYGTEICMDHMPEGIYADDNKESFYKHMIRYNNFVDPGIQNCVWSKLYKKQLLVDNISYLSDDIRIGEDAGLLYCVLVDAERIYVSHKSYYFYVMRDESMVHKPDHNYYQNISVLYQSLSTKFNQCSRWKNVLLYQLDQYMATEVVRGLNNRFGFSIKDLLPLYLFPEELDQKKRIVLYGAGQVGRDFYKQLRYINHNNIVLWVDMNADQLEIQDVKNVDAMSGTDYDLVLIAVKSEDIAVSITEELCKRNVNKQKILWRRPQFLLDTFGQNNKQFTAFQL